MHVQNDFIYVYIWLLEVDIMGLGIALWAAGSKKLLCQIR